METFTSNINQVAKSEEGIKAENLKVVLFMAFIPSIYLIGKVVSQLF